MRNLEDLRYGGCLRCQDYSASGRANDPGFNRGASRIVHLQAATPNLLPSLVPSQKHARDKVPRVLSAVAARVWLERLLCFRNITNNTSIPLAHSRHSLARQYRELSTSLQQLHRRAPTVTMADNYDTLKVPDLKKLLKDRSIASTGLTRKAQYIAALREKDGDALADENNTRAADQEADAVASVASSVTLPADDPHLEHLEHVEPQAKETVEPHAEAEPTDDAPTTAIPELSASSELTTPAPTTQEVVGKCFP
jgi:hypothetical protein